MTTAPHPRAAASGPALVVTIDVECDKGPDWRTRSPLSFVGVRRALPELLAPLCARFAVRPTYLVSPEVLCDDDAVQALRSLPDCELGAHLHGDYIAPRAAARDLAGTRTDEMQWEYGEELELDKLATLTELFAQQLDARPRSFRAGRFGAGPATGALLRQLGYLVDTSVTPHVTWTSSSGVRLPDFSSCLEHPYFIDRRGDLTRPGDSTLLEVPVTIRRLSGRQQPVWFRPWYSPVADMCALIDLACAEDRAGHPAALNMMFHNVELVPGASPYPQTAADVTRYLDDLARVFAHARARGLRPMTLAELYLEARQRAPAGTGPVQAIRAAAAPSRRDRALRLPAPSIAAVVERHGTQPWHAYSADRRPERWDLTEPYAWIAEHFAPDARVLDVACGIGQNLLWLAQQGFERLLGFDLDAAAVAAGRELAAGAGVRLWVDDGLAPLGLPAHRFEVITALNWTSLVEGFELHSFVAAWAERLSPGGVLVLDAIDRRFDLHEMQRWLTSDWGKPEAQRRPSEYRNRFARAEVEAAAAAAGLAVEVVFSRRQEVPKAVFVLRKAARRPRVLFVVDEPGWAHDAKTEALRRCLREDFDIRKRYHRDLQPADLDAADLAVVYYWRQLTGSERVRDALERNRDKLLVGICSHAELEGELREPGLAALARHARAVFVHNALLYAEFAPLLAMPVYYTPNGVDLDLFRPGDPPANARLRVGWAGSLQNFGRDLRGFDAIAEACAALPGVELAPAIKEDGSRRHEAMAEYYRGLDVYVCASRCEGTPNPCLEAAACGVPLVTTPVGNMPELVRDGENGFFVRPEAADIRAKLERLLGDPALRSRMRATLLRDVAAWSWRARAGAFRAMLGAELARRAATPLAQAAHTAAPCTA
jgi:glycosyltransferase involved in cell wall biosynthesis/2-polyprenyl-3-methyl-5-hydroxy-6-metoxy-1,4-benzoquinol methylase